MSRPPQEDRRPAPSDNNGVLRMREQVTAYKKELIFRVACETFWEHGYHDTTVDMLATRLDGSKAIFYYYYEDKLAVLEEIFRRSMFEAQAVAQAAIRLPGSAAERLSTFTREYVRWVIDHQSLVDIFWREERTISPALRREIAFEQRRLDELVADILRAGVAEGDFDVEDFTVTARAIAGMTTFISNWWKSGRRVGRDEVAEHFAQLALRVAGYRNRAGA